MRNYIDVNALVTERVLLLTSLEKNADELHFMRRKYQELESEYKSLLCESPALAENCTFLKDILVQNRYVEGANSDSASEYDSGKHSDHSFTGSENSPEFDICHPLYGDTKVRKEDLINFY